MQRSAFVALLATLAVPAWADTHYSYVDPAAGEVYFGHVSYCEPGDDGPVAKVVRTERVEPAEVNVPLAPGDRVLTPQRRRCEVQFDTGTLIRLDGGSTLRIETVLAPSLTRADKLTNLVLEAGRLRVLYRDYDSDEVFQVLTPNAAIKLDRAAVVDMARLADGTTSVRVERGRAAVLYGPRADRTRTRKLKAGQGLRVLPNDQLEPPAPAAAAAEFAAWNRELDERFVETHAGRNKLPKPVYRYPRAVVHFAEKYSNLFGEWVWTDLHGYAWRPYLSRDEGWRPYLMGHWTAIDGRLFWVPQEPWGWVPYHLGLWHWDTRAGWVWFPGSMFAPAWVTWSPCNGAVAWQPLGLWDWFSWQDPSRPPGSPLLVDYSAAPYGGLGLTGCGPRSFRSRYMPVAPEPTTVVVTTSMAPAAQPSPQPTPDPGPDDERPRIPREIRQLSERFGKRVENGDPNAIESLRRTALLAEALRPEEARTADEPAPRPAERSERAVTSPAGRLERHPPADPASRAESSDASVRRAGPTREVQVERRSQARFRDWNRDVRAARDVGGRIRYDSARNSVVCDDCRRPLVRPAWLRAGDFQRSPSGTTGSVDASGGTSSTSTVTSGGAGAGSSRDTSAAREKQHQD